MGVSAQNLRSVCETESTAIESYINDTNWKQGRLAFESNRQPSICITEETHRKKPRQKSLQIYQKYLLPCVANLKKIVS
jgi:hypothetical protein